MWLLSYVRSVLKFCCCITGLNIYVIRREWKQVPLHLLHLQSIQVSHTSLLLRITLFEFIWLFIMYKPFFNGKSRCVVYKFDCVFKFKMEFCHSLMLWLKFGLYQFVLISNFPSFIQSLIFSIHFNLYVTECDIRSCLNTLQFLNKKKETLNAVRVWYDPSFAEFSPFFSCYIRSKNPEELHDNQIVPWMTHSVIIIIECEHPGGSSEICKANYLSFADYSLIKKAFTISD